MNIEGQYEDRWLLKLRATHPQEADRLSRDRAARDRVNQVMNAIKDPEVALDTLRMAYTMGWKGDDPIWLAFIRIMGLQRRLEQDAGKAIEDLDTMITMLRAQAGEHAETMRESELRLEERLNALSGSVNAFNEALGTARTEIKGFGAETIAEMRGASNEAIEELRDATASQIDLMQAAVAETARSVDEQGARILGGLQAGSEQAQQQLREQLAIVLSQTRNIDMRLAAFPDALEAVVGRINSTAEDSVRIFIASHAKYTVAEEARRESEHILDDIRNLGGDMSRAVTRFDAVAQASKAIQSDADLIVGKIQLGRKWLLRAVGGLVLAAFGLGMATAVVATDVTQVGLSNDIRRQIVAGRTYLSIYPYLSADARRDIVRETCLLSATPNAKC